MTAVPKSIKGKVRWALSIAFFVLAILSALSSVTALLALVGLAPRDYYGTDAFLALYTLPTWAAWMQTLILVAFSALYGWLALSLWKRDRHAWIAAIVLALLQLSSVIITFASGDGIAVLELSWVIVSLALAWYTRHWRHLPV